VPGEDRNNCAEPCLNPLDDRSKPLFRGHDYVEQINLILDVLGTPAGKA
jgi:hypothetical protein